MVATETTNDSRQRPIAPAWHTIIVLLILLGLSIAGARSQNLLGISTHQRAAGYALIMVVEWVTVAFIWYGVSRRGLRMSDLIAGSWARPVAFLRDLGIALAFLIICGMGVINGLGYLLKAAPNQAIRNLYPHGHVEVILWLLLALTAGFCEEVIFRGYLQHQFTALTRAAMGGIVLQGIVFGVSHGYQGWKFMLLISVYGILFGLLAQWRRSLRPGMITHFLQDGVGGLIASHFLR
ncbi:MAG TPA: type II CAAX endopeptidase family protein [Terriglobales bacterium]|nr:type II CAAX endopeptidase family protein [Terriglobales bacterium]